MRRLIDANNIRGFAKYADYTEKEGEFKPYITLDNLVKFIDEQPTAYDVDAVVKQLKTDSSVKLHGSSNSDNYLIPVKRAIEIVKGGGTNETD